MRIAVHNVWVLKNGGGDMTERAGETKCANTSLLASLNGVAVLTRDDLDLGRRDLLVLLHLETRILHDERPHVVAETVGMEVTLRTLGVSSSHGQGDGAEPDLERGLGLDRLHHGVCEGLVELEVCIGQPWTGCERMRYRTCCRTFIASCGVMAPLIISSSKESVNAIPMLEMMRSQCQSRCR